MTTSDRFRKISEEADRLHFDDPTVGVSPPGEGEAGWLVGFGPETEVPLGASGATLDDALDALIAAMAELRITIGGTES